MTDKITVYGHAMCPQVGPVRYMLRKAGADHEYVDIHRDEAARERVRQINNGNESVPTLVFPDGSTLTEPSANTLRSTLQTMGYEVPLSAWLVANRTWILVGAVVIYAALRFLGVL